MEIKNTFGTTLKKLREDAGLSQEKLASDLAVGQTTVSRWELRESAPREDVLKMIADYFGVSVSSLLSSETVVREAQRGLVREYLQALRLYTHQSEERFDYHVHLQRSRGLDA